jgi:hypothetical protein
MSRLLVLLVLLMLAFMSIGCTYKTIDRPITITTKPLPEAVKTEVRGGAKEVTGTSCNRVVLLFIPVGFATIESAYADALGKAPGADAILDYQERTTAMFVFPFYYEVCSEVHGYAVQSKNVASN